MSKSSSVPWWSSLGFGKAAPAKDTDYGDMGTAFGLDASMDTLPMPVDGNAASTERSIIALSPRTSTASTTISPAACPSRGKTCGAFISHGTVARRLVASVS